MNRTTYGFFRVLLLCTLLSIQNIPQTAAQEVTGDNHDGEQGQENDLAPIEDHSEDIEGQQITEGDERQGVQNVQDNSGHQVDDYSSDGDQTPDEQEGHSADGENGATAGYQEPGAVGQEPQGAAVNGQGRQGAAVNEQQPEGAQAGQEPEGAQAGEQEHEGAQAGQEPEAAQADEQEPEGAQAGQEPEGAQAGEQEPEGAQAGQEPEGAQAGEQEHEGAQAGQEPEAAQADEQEPEGAQAGQELEGAQAGQEPEGAQAGEQEPEGAQAGQEPEGAQAGQEPEGAQAGQEPEGAQAGEQEPEAAAVNQEPEGAAVNNPEGQQATMGGQDEAALENEGAGSATQEGVGSVIQEGAGSAVQEGAANVDNEIDHAQSAVGPDVVYDDPEPCTDGSHTCHVNADCLTLDFDPWYECRCQIFTHVGDGENACDPVSCNNDNSCEKGETACGCTNDDCGPCCGDDVCDDDESIPIPERENGCNCPEDCNAPCCGKNDCEKGEDCDNCPKDCRPCCGDGYCDTDIGPENRWENSCRCPEDCGGECCGNHMCQGGETGCTCEKDCGPCCGDFICVVDENYHEDVTCCDDCDTCPRGSIVSRVYFDGAIGYDDVGIPDVTLNLYVDSNADGAKDIDDTLLSTATTDETGTYEFLALREGPYILLLTDVNQKLTGLLQLVEGIINRLGSEVVGVVNGTTLPIQLEMGQDIAGAFFVYQGGIIGDSIWHDSNDNGVYDGNETGIDGVTLSLYRDADADGELDEAVDTFVETLKTGNGGDYAFRHLSEGVYFVLLVDEDDVVLEFMTTNAMKVVTPVTLVLNETNLDIDYGFIEIPTHVCRVCSINSCEFLGLEVDGDSALDSERICGGSDLPNLGGKCHEHQRWAEAFTVCASAGMRLCSVEEIEAKEVYDTGCNLDDREIWSNTECMRVGLGFKGHYAIYGDGSGERHCRSQGENCNVRCCADDLTDPLCCMHEECDACSAKTCGEASIPGAGESDDPNICGTSEPGGTGTGCAESFLSYHKADQTCLDKGLRLCNVFELTAGEAQNAGCTFDDKYSWTSSICGSDVEHGLSYYIATGNSGLGEPQCKSVSDHMYPEGLRCCAEVDNTVPRCCRDSTPVTEINECEENIDNCHPNATCTDTEYYFDCECNEGLQGDGFNCYVDGCAAGCDPNGSCDPATHTCVCNAFFAGDGSQCEECIVCSEKTCSDLGIFSQAAEFGSPYICGESDGPLGECSDSIPMPFQNAQKFCMDGGMRLCTSQEMIDNEAADTGCDLDGMYIWTADECATGLRIVVEGKDGAGTAICKVEKLLKHVRCCADIDNKREECCNIEQVLETVIDDLDECEIPEDNDCDPDAICTDTSAYYHCECPADGYKGDGTTCEACVPCGAWSCEDLGLDPASAGLATACGTGDGGDIGVCPPPKIAGLAEAVCATGHMRLCSVQELLANELLGNNCALDGRWVWSRDKCTVNGEPGHFVHKGVTPGDPTPAVCRADSVASRFGCCADANQRDMTCCAFCESQTCQRVTDCELQMECGEDGCPTMSPHNEGELCSDGMGTCNSGACQGDCVEFSQKIWSGRDYEAANASFAECCQACVDSVVCKHFSHRIGGIDCRLFNSVAEGYGTNIRYNSDQPSCMSVPRETYIGSAATFVQEANFPTFESCCLRCYELGDSCKYVSWHIAQFYCRLFSVDNLPKGSTTKWERSADVLSDAIEITATGGFIASSGAELAAGSAEIDVSATASADIADMQSQQLGESNADLETEGGLIDEGTGIVGETDGVDVGDGTDGELIDDGTNAVDVGDGTDGELIDGGTNAVAVGDGTDGELVDDETNAVDIGDGTNGVDAGDETDGALINDGTNAVDVGDGTDGVDVGETAADVGDGTADVGDGTNAMDIDVGNDAGTGANIDPPDDGTDGVDVGDRSGDADADGTGDVSDGTVDVAADRIAATDQDVDSGRGEVSGKGQASLSAQGAAIPREDVNAVDGTAAESADNAVVAHSADAGDDDDNTPLRAPNGGGLNANPEGGGGVETERNGDMSVRDPPKDLPETGATY